MVGGGDPFYLKFWVNRPPLERNRRLQPLLDGTIGSCFAMTEPAVYSRCHFILNTEHTADIYRVNVKSIPPVTFGDILAMNADFCVKFYTTVKQESIHFSAKFFRTVTSLASCWQSSLPYTSQSLRRVESQLADHLGRAVRRTCQPDSAA